MSGESSSPSMTLPVQTHICRLSQLLTELQSETNQAQKDLHILRSSINQLSFINKESDMELNDYLTHSISTIKAQWANEWQIQKSEMVECYRKLCILGSEQEDIEIKREEVEGRVSAAEESIGLGLGLV